METFAQWHQQRHQYAQAWKARTGGKVLGYFCTYMPEEIIYAAGVLPVRIMGSSRPRNPTQPHILDMYCPFCRDCLAQGLQGGYDYLDGLAIAQSCLHIRQAYTSWALHMPREFSYYLPMPHQVQSPRAIPFLRAELELFKEALEAWVGRKITQDDLDRGIAILNESRQALADLNATRQKRNPPLTGLEALYVSMSSQVIHKTEHSQELRALMAEELPGRDLGLGGRPRLMVLGSGDDHRRFTGLVESLGAVVVIDDHCLGTRYFWNQVEPGEDRLLAIAKRYVNRPPCPTKDWPQRTRLEHLAGLAGQWEVDGALILQQQSCHPHQLDAPAQRDRLGEAGVPSLIVELEACTPLDRCQGRVEAFLAQLGQE